MSSSYWTSDAYYMWILLTASLATPDIVQSYPGHTQQKEKWQENELEEKQWRPTAHSEEIVENHTYRQRK